MSSVTIAADLANNVFELAVSPRPGQITERHRLTRAKFERFCGRKPIRVRILALRWMEVVDAEVIT